MRPTRVGSSTRACHRGVCISSNCVAVKGAPTILHISASASSAADSHTGG